MNRVGCNQKGFTLVELLAALTIFAVGMLGVAGMQLTGLRENATSHARTAAVALAAGIMEEILVWPTDDVRLAADSTGTAWTFSEEPVVGPTKTITGAGTFRATYDVNIDYNAVTNVNRIQVTVTGPGRPITLVAIRGGR